MSIVALPTVMQDRTVVLYSAIFPKSPTLLKRTLVKMFAQNNGTVQKVHDGTTVLSLEITRNNLQKVFLSLESVFGDQFRTNENFLYQTAHADYTKLSSRTPIPIMET